MGSTEEIYFTSISESVQDALSVAEYRGGLLDLKGSPPSPPPSPLPPLLDE